MLPKYKTFKHDTNRHSQSSTNKCDQGKKILEDNMEMSTQKTSIWRTWDVMINISLGIEPVKLA